MNQQFVLEGNPGKRVKTDMLAEELEEKPIIFQGNSVYVFIDKCSRAVSKFLKDVCEPISKPQKVHEYALTTDSLVRAQALGYKKEQIINTFERNMRNKGSIPPEVKRKIVEFVRESDCQMQLVWTPENCYYNFIVERSLYDNIRRQVQVHLQAQEEGRNFRAMGDKNHLTFRVKKFSHTELQQKLLASKMPVKADRVINSYSPDLKTLKKYKHVGYCHDIQINLKSFTQLREYQSEALNTIVKLEKDNKVNAKSGYVVLPCGAGKTLLGISILCKIKKEALIVCSSDSGTEQWKREIEKWTQSFPREQIIIITSENNFEFKNSVHGQIFISTYSFLKNHISDFIKNSDQWLINKPWGLVIFDQCQTLPAPENRIIARKLACQSKIGLTATPFREDDNIKALNYMIGPQLYVGDWKSFVVQGYLANPKCIEIRTELTPYFKDKYANSKSRKESSCYIINPNKIKALIYLLHHHEQLNDHILVFSDYTEILKYVAMKLRRPILKGDAKQEERMFIFDMFRQGKIKTLFLSRIGDEAIDLPNANVGIELNIHHGSRKQMLQRLGRIMRQKEASSSLSYNAIFYTITTYNTFEWKYFFKRYQCLIDQGFHYDLRLFEFRPKDEDIQNILELDNKIRDEIEDKFKAIVGNEEDYWNLLANKVSEQDQ